MATYCLLIDLMKDSKIQIGKLGNLEFNKGYYVYVGSALNSLEGRIKRHLRDEKKLFWHVDYLLNSSNARIVNVIFENSPQKWECEIASAIASKSVQIDKFGCSDCKCRSHLIYFESKDYAERSSLNAFKKFGLDAQNFDVH